MTGKKISSSKHATVKMMADKTHAAWTLKIEYKLQKHANMHILPEYDI